MRGVPLAITSRITSSWPPSEALESGGPKVAAPSCCLRWHTAQDWPNNCRPSCWAALRSSAAATDAKDSPATTTHAAITTLRISLLLRLGLECLQVGLAAHRHHGDLAGAIDRQNDLQFSVALGERDVADFRSAARQIEISPS